MSRPLPAGAAASALAWLAERAVERGYPEPHLEGVSLGGCASAHRTAWLGAMRRSAHAHSDPRDPLVGWLCFKADRVDVIESVTGPTVLARHEYAHLLAPRDHGHGQAWRRAVIALGAPAEATRYEKAAAARKARRESTVWFVAGHEPMTDAEYRAFVRGGRR